MSSDGAAGDALLLAELRHRFANFVQMIQGLVHLRARSAQTPEARECLTFVSDTIRTLFELQTKLGLSGGHPFATHLRDMAAGWSRIGASQGVQIDIEADDDAVLDGDAASLLALISHELVTNCFEHGFPDGRAGRIAIRFGADGQGALELTVTDDGAGLDPARTGLARSQGLGLIGALADRLSGEFTLSPGLHGGTTARIRLPAPAEATMSPEKAAGGSQDFLSRIQTGA